jgi:signal transduction histidine kinase
MFELPDAGPPPSMSSKVDPSERLVAAWGALPIGAVVVWAEGAPTLNPAARRLLGGHESTLVESTAVRRALAGERVEGERVTIDDRVIAIDASPIAGANGTPAGAACTLRDVTDRMLDEEMGDELLGKAAHDLRTPLTALKACVQLVERGLERLEPAARARTLTLLVAQVDKLSGKIDDVLDAARIRRGRVDVEPIDLDVSAELATIAEETAKLPGAPPIDLRVESGLRAHFDPTRLRQIVRGLLLESRRVDHRAIVLRADRAENRSVEIIVEVPPALEDRRARTVRRLAIKLTSKLGGEAIEAKDGWIRLRLPAPRSAG